jgi:hypothetical protein
MTDAPKVVPIEVKHTDSSHGTKPAPAVVPSKPAVAQPAVTKK